MERRNNLLVRGIDFRKLMESRKDSSLELLLGSALAMVQELGWEEVRPLEELTVLVRPEV